MGKPTATSRVRSREEMEEQHLGRLTLPSAEDRCSGRGPTSSAVSCHADRFIPIRSADQSVLDGLRSPGQPLVPSSSLTPTSSAFNALLACQLGIKTPPQDPQLPGTCMTPSSVPRNEKGRVLQFSATPEKAPSPYDSSLLSTDGARWHQMAKAPDPTKYRHVSTKPYTVLDAPGLMDDYYSNLIDWSQQDLLAVALADSLYVYNTVTCKTFKLASYEVSIRSVSWSQSGAHLCVGLETGEVALWDINRMAQLRIFQGHTNTVSALSWNSHLLSSAGREGIVLNRDMRVPEDSVAALRGHRGHICGLKWSHDGWQLASGGSDNLVLLWHAGMSRPHQRLTAHTACIKALTWSPHQAGFLATGGGLRDHTIALWNTVKGSIIYRIDTGSQVCGLAWSQTVNELLSTHGFVEPGIHLWKVPSLVKTATLAGHRKRVLHLAMSPDGQTAATGAGDDTVKFWQIFPKDTAKSATAQLVRFDRRYSIR